MSCPLSRPCKGTVGILWFEDLRSESYLADREPETVRRRAQGSSVREASCGQAGGVPALSRGQATLSYSGFHLRLQTGAGAEADSPWCLRDGRDARGARDGPSVASWAPRALASARPGASQLVKRKETLIRMFSSDRDAAGLLVPQMGKAGLIPTPSGPSSGHYTCPDASTHSKGPRGISMQPSPRRPSYSAAPQF